MTDPSKLSDVLARMEPLVVDDEAAAEHDRIIREGQLYEARVRRQEALDRNRVPLTAAMERALVDGGGALERSRALRAVQRWLALPTAPPIVVLAGKTGTGKTVAAAHALVERRGGIWQTAPQLCRIFSANFGEQYADREACLSAGVLICDDVGTELEPERMAAILVEIIEARQRRVTKTLITTNLNRQEFASRYRSDRLTSRMDPSGGIVAWVETATDRDMRRQK